MDADRGCKIVLIDDLADFTMILKSVLEMDGHTVHTATDSSTGLQLIRTLRPQLAFIDIGLPAIDGYMVARTIRAEGINTFLVALTAYGGDKAKVRAVEAGFDRHILKPLLPDERREMVSLAMERAAAQQRM
jgi:two-component system, sensor histidine kinase